MAQFARPDSDISIGLWTDDVGGTTNIWDTLNDNTTTEYIESLNGNNTTGEFGLTTITDPVSSIDHNIRFSMQGTGSGGPERLNVQLFQGGTLIAQSGNMTSRGSWTTQLYLLSAAEADAITNYADLRFKIISSNLGGTEDMWCAWAELEVPDVSAGGGNGGAMYHHLRNMGAY